MKSQTQIETAQAAKIAKRLLNHWKHKFEVEQTEQDMKIFMPSATVILSPNTDNLDVNIDFKTDDVSQERLEQVVLEHLARMGQEELQAHWQRQ